MVVATTALPTRKTRKKPQPTDQPAAVETAPETAGGQDLPDSETDIQRLSARLRSFGFDVPAALIEQWDGTTFTNIELILSRWQDEFDRANAGEPITDSDRTLIPAILEGMESVSPELAQLAKDNAQVAANAKASADCNLYPVGSLLSAIWLEAFTAGTPTEAKRGSPPDLTVPANAAELQAAKERREADAKVDRERQQQIAIESALCDMEEAVTHQEELAEQLVDMKAEMKELKSSYDNAVVRGQKASKALRRARAGIFERTLPFPKDAKPASLEVPDQDIGGKASTKPKVDEGAFISLDHLVKGDLQEFIPGTPEDKGISAKQADTLKKAVDGDTIGKLEAFQRSKGEWWTKEISGFGKETVTKLQDAHEIVRRKFPVPEPDEMEEAPATTAESDPPVIAAEEALAQLDKLIDRCEVVGEECESDDGVEFLDSVAKQADSMYDTIDKLGNVTPDQTRAIINWEAGVEKWATGETVPATAGENFGDDLDVPDANGEEDEDDE